MNNIQFNQGIYKKITGRENQVAQAARGGKSIQETADLLGIKPSTVKSHRCRMMAKLGCKNITDVVVSLINAGIL